ncbi:MAG TPA: restriction endonuclease subunit S [Chloroflexota bacterium]|nr:restriction endonuclease subunit S [Chloroflexota bacterium]
MALIRSQNVYKGRFHPRGLAFLSDQHAEEMAGVAVEAGDLLLNITGDSVARCCQAPEAVVPARVNQHVSIIRPDSDRLDANFLCYYMISPIMQSYLLSLAGSGGTRKALTKEMIERFEVPCPPISSQLAIASFLSHYDDLIANNTRRMALLEQAARLLFDEWFVRLRFPGHEHTRLSEGMPDGWTATDLEASCIPIDGIQTGPFGSQLHEYDYTDEGIPVVMPKDIVGTRIATDDIARVPDSLRDRLSRHILSPGDIVLARRGDIGRKAFISSRESGWLCGTGCMRLRPNAQIVEPRFLFETLGRPEVIGIIVSRAQGAIMPNLNLTIMSDVPVVLPPRSLQRQFIEYATPMYRQVEVLDQQNQKLQEARDLFLPRLMSGQVAV